MNNILKNALAGVYLGAFFSVIWFCMAYFQPKTILIITAFIWFVFIMFALMILLCLKALKSKLFFALFIIVIWLLLFGIGKTIGLNFLPALHITTGLQFYPQSWMLYPFIGLLFVALCGCTSMFFFIVEEIADIKKRWHLSFGILVYMLAFWLPLTLSYFLTALI